MSSDQLHVLIAGGGPVGLLSAIGLCKQGIRVTMVERETRERLVVHTNGAGFVMYSCSNYILKRLGIDDKAINVSREWDFLELLDQNDKLIKAFEFTDVLKKDTSIGRIQGSTPTARFVLAKIFLDELDKYAAAGLFDLHFKTQVTGYEQVSEEKVVLLAKRGDEELKFEGDLLFGCDGVHSLIRKQMMKEMKVNDDYLIDTGLTAYWGKYEENEEKNNFDGPSMGNFISKTADTARGYAKIGGPKDPSYFIWGYGPASAETRKSGLAWAYMTRTGPEKKNEYDVFKAQKGEEIDLNNRGAKKGEAVRKELLERADKDSQLAYIVKQTDSERLLKTNLLYHNKMDAPYSFGRVCILGDASHPESPAAGQGLNMALVDGYVLPLFLAGALKEGKQNVPAALKEYADFQTRKDITKMAMASFSFTDMIMAKNPFFYGVIKPVLKFASAKMFLGQMLLKAEDLNFSRCFKAEAYATSKGVKIDEAVSV